jgi:hypothetical protein
MEGKVLYERMLTYPDPIEFENMLSSTQKKEFLKYQEKYSNEHQLSLNDRVRDEIEVNINK